VQVPLPVSIVAAREGLRTPHTSNFATLFLVHFLKVSHTFCSLLLKVVAGILS